MSATTTRERYTRPAEFLVALDVPAVIRNGFNPAPHGLATILVDVTILDAELRDKLAERICPRRSSVLVSKRTGDMLKVKAPTPDGLWDAIMEDETP